MSIDFVSCVPFRIRINTSRHFAGRPRPQGVCLRSSFRRTSRRSPWRRSSCPQLPSASRLCRKRRRRTDRLFSWAPPFRLSEVVRCSPCSWVQLKVRKALAAALNSSDLFGKMAGRPHPKPSAQSRTTQHYYHYLRSQAAPFACSPLGPGTPAATRIGPATPTPAPTARAPAPREGPAAPHPSTAAARRQGGRPLPSALVAKAARERRHPFQSPSYHCCLLATLTAFEVVLMASSVP